MRENTRKIFIYTALACEAKPLVNYFNLKKDVTVQQFAVYLSEDICLTVTGLGKSAMAAGVAYTQALFASGEPLLMLNIGIASHKNHPLGRLFLIDKITDNDSQRSYYPSLISTLSCATDSISTLSKPQFTYDQSCLCDMEASAFYETAVRFASSEYIYCLKVISDNKSSPAENILAKQVCLLIEKHIPIVELLLVRAFAGSAFKIRPESSLFDQIIQRYHFTFNEKRQLKSQLSRWNIVTNYQRLEFDGVSLNRAKDVLRWIDIKIHETDFIL
jgi:nucleoside phosphorylase